MSDDAALPPGCRPANVCRGESRLHDLSPGQLWRLLGERRQCELFRLFFRREWAELAALLDEKCHDNAIRTHWLAWRDAAVSRMAMAGEIQLQHGREETW